MWRAIFTCEKRTSCFPWSFTWEAFESMKEIKKPDLCTVTEKLEVCASGNISVCFIELCHQAEETRLFYCFLPLAQGSEY